MPKIVSQTIPKADAPFVSKTTLALTMAAYAFLNRIQQGVTGTVQNVDVIGQAVGLPVETITPSGSGYGTGATVVETVIPTIPASFPPPPSPNGALAARVAALEAMILTSQPDRQKLAPEPLPAPPPRPVAGPEFSLPMPPMPPMGIVTLHNGTRLIDGFGAPSGLVIGWIGDVYLQRDGASDAVIWSKESGAETSSGWVAVGSSGGGGGGSSTGGVLPLVNGDLPGPAFITDPYGQTIGVPV